MTTESAKLRSPVFTFFSKQKILRLLESFVESHPKVYLSLIIPFALLGYILLFIFPLSALILLWRLATLLPANEVTLFSIAVQLLLVLAALGFSLPLLKIRFKPPLGLELNADNAPRLIKELDELSQTYKVKQLKRVIVDSRFGVDVYNYSRLGLPLPRFHTLIVGLPAFQCLSPLHFKALLARRVGQLSGRDNHLVFWLATLRNTWQQYRSALNKGSLFAMPMAVIFRLYAPLYQRMAVFTTRMNELAADRYALDLINDQDMAELFSQEIITVCFLEQKYWPKIQQLAMRKNRPVYPPHQHMPKVLRNGLDKTDMENWIKQALPDNLTHLDRPPLLLRLHNIGHEKPLSPRPLKQTAAEHYLGITVLEKVIEKFDQRWIRMQKTQ